MQVVVHRDLSLARDGRRVMAKAGLLVGGILLILGVALGLANYLVYAQLPDALANWSLAHVPSRWMFLLGLNVVLIFVGGFVEIYAAIIVLVPLLVPIGARLGIDLVHLGVIFLSIEDGMQEESQVPAGTQGTGHGQTDGRLGIPMFSSIPLPHAVGTAFEKTVIAIRRRDEARRNAAYPEKGRERGA